MSPRSVTGEQRTPSLCRADPAALRVLERDDIPQIASVLVRRGVGTDDVDDVTQALREHLLVDGASIGRIHGVHRATAARWLARARAMILEATQARLVAEPGLDADAVTGPDRAVASPHAPRASVVPCMVYDRARRLLMAMVQIDVRPWNLGVPLVLLAACGRTLIIPLDDGDTGTTDPNDTIEPTTETDSIPPSPEAGDECRNDDDCRAGYSCFYGFCSYDGYYCDDGCCDGGCWYYECYDDAQCGPGYECVAYYCQPRPMVEPQQCYETPNTFGDALPIAAFTGQVSLAFVDSPRGGEEVVIGDGQGLATFGPAGLAVIETIPVSALATGDLDADGDEDIVFAEEETIPGSTLRVMLRDGEGFVPGGVVEVPRYFAEEIEIVDTDGTGTPDVFIATDDGTIWLEGVGMGQLAPPASLFIGESCGLAALDVPPRASFHPVLVSVSGSPQIVYSPFRYGGLPTEVTHSTSCMARSGDVDGDVWGDYVMLERTSPPVLSTWWGVELFNFPVVWPMPVSASALAVGDLDGDGRDDVVTTDPVGPTMIRFGGPGSTPDGSYDPLGCYVLLDLGFAPFVVALGDLDGDGRLDLVGADDGQIWLSPGA